LDLKGGLGGGVPLKEIEGKGKTKGDRGWKRERDRVMIHRPTIPGSATVNSKQRQV